MSTHPLISDEAPRHPGTQANDLMHTPVEARFNRLARLTRRALGTRVAAISFVNDEGEWFKAVTGWNISQLTPERSLAAGLVQGGETVVIPDMLEDARTRNHPLVVGSPRFRFCALQPILRRSGGAIGILAAYDVAPQKVRGDLREALSDAAELVRRELRVSELGGLQDKLLASLDTGGRAALLDDLTRLWNRQGAMLLLEQALAGGTPAVSIGACVLGVDGFKKVNDNFGYAMGNVVLRKLGAAIVDSVRPGDITCRLGGDKFLLMIPNVDPDQLGHIMDRVKDRVQSLRVRTKVGSVKVVVSIGGTLASEGDRPDDVLRRADDAMRYGKRRRDGDEVVELSLEDQEPADQAVPDT